MVEVTGQRMYQLGSIGEAEPLEDICNKGSVIKI